MTNTQDKEPSFEKAFHRLEQILERMNAQDVALEESLLLFEEANSLMNLCHRRLQDAEKRVDVLVKNRQGELSMGAGGQPETAPFKGGTSP